MKNMKCENCKYCYYYFAMTPEKRLKKSYCSFYVKDTGWTDSCFLFEYDKSSPKPFDLVVQKVFEMEAEFFSRMYGLLDKNREEYEKNLNK